MFKCTLLVKYNYLRSFSPRNASLLFFTNPAIGPLKSPRPSVRKHKNEYENRYIDFDGPFKNTTENIVWLIIF